MMFRWFKPMMGGGFGIQDPSTWGVSVDSTPAGASDNTDIFTAGPNEIIRVYAVASNVTAGVAPSAIVRVRIAGSTITPSVSSALLLTSVGQVYPDLVRQLIVPPGATLDIFHFAGDAATIVRTTALIMRLPLGSVPGI